MSFLVLGRIKPAVTLLEGAWQLAGSQTIIQQRIHYRVHVNHAVLPQTYRAQCAPLHPLLPYHTASAA